MENIKSFIKRTIKILSVNNRFITIDYRVIYAGSWLAKGYGPIHQPFTSYISTGCATSSTAPGVV